MEAQRTAAPATRSAESAVDQRIAGILEWLETTAPECFDEQLHVVEGTAERVYWHYGYMVALRDLRALLFEKNQTRN